MPSVLTVSSRAGPAILRVRSMPSRATISSTAEPAATPTRTARRAPRVWVASHTTKATATMPTSTAATPLAPVWAASTQTSQATVRNMGKASSWRKVSIHGPGLGRWRRSHGLKLTSR